MAAQPIIRWATEQDVPEILAMIKELAHFENADHEVHATEQTLLKTLSFPTASSTSSPSDSPEFTPGFSKTLLITHPASDGQAEQVAGMALFFNNYSTWRSSPGIYLEDLFVRPAFRRGGYATMLLQRLAQEARKVSGDVGRLEWACLRWNENALSFYKRIGGVRQDEWVTIRVEDEGLKKLSEWNK